MGAGVAVDGGELLLGGIQVAGQGGGAGAGVAEEDRGGIDGVRGVLAEVVAQAPGGQGGVEIAGDLRQSLPEPEGGPGQGPDDVIGGGRLAEPGFAPP